MKFSVATAVLALATAAVAVPGTGYHPTQADRDLKVKLEKFEKSCGSNNQVSCCNEEIKKVGGNSAPGLIPILSALDVSDLSLMKGCSKLDVAALIGVQDLLNSKCKTQVSCCESGPTNQIGLVNVDAKCAVHNIL